MTEVASSVLSAVLSEIAKNILERVKRGEKLSAEELMLLLLDLNYRQVLELRKELVELYRQLDAKVESVRKEVLELHHRLDQKMDSRIDALSKRLDSIYQLLLRMLERRVGVG